MTDIFDQASDIEALERDRILAAHAARPQHVPLCEACEDVPVVVTAAGTRWRFCQGCADEHIRSMK